MPKARKDKESKATSETPSSTKAKSTVSVDHVWDKIEEWLKKNSPKLFADLKPGATEQELKEFEKKTGLKLPDDYRASLKRHNGEVSLTSYTYLSVTGSFTDWEMMTQLDEQGKFKDAEIEGTSDLKLKPVWWSKGWIPFAEDSGGNMLCLDSDPGKRGRIGQVLYMELQGGPRASKYKSFGEWLDRYRKDLYQGKYEVDNEGFLAEKI